MTKKLLLVIAVSLFLTVFAAPVLAAYAPHQGDNFTYYETTSLGSGTGNYQGYSEQATYNGAETVTSVNAGVVSAHYSYSYSWSNSTGTTETGSQSGDFTYSATSFLYLNGTDDQEGYVNPTVWFCMDPSTPQGGTFTLLNTQMTVISASYPYYLPSENRNVDVIYAQGSSSYQRNDVYGEFNAAYTWNAYFDPATGYIVGYDYTEHDTNSSGNGFTYTENLYVKSASYPLTAASSSATPVESNGSTSTSTPVAFFSIILIAIVILIVVIAVVVIAVSRSRRPLPKHSYEQPYQQHPPTAPPNVDLTPKEQPPVQQVVVKEVVKVKCRYCGALIDSTAERCPVCGAPRT